MTFQRKKGILIACLFFLVFASCIKTQYKSLKDKQIESGRVENDIFFGIQFGLSSKDFYKYCWDLNKKGLLRESSDNAKVEKKLAGDLDSVYIRFYPEFKQDKLYNMKCEFMFSSWAPWNSRLNSDSLLVEVKNYFNSWYGENEYLELSLDDNKEMKFWVSIEGNRRLLIFKGDDSSVKAIITDLTALDNE
jgi:hypothetical protein